MSFRKRVEEPTRQIHSNVGLMNLPQHTNFLLIPHPPARNFTYILQFRKNHQRDEHAQPQSVILAVKVFISIFATDYHRPA